MADDRYGQMFNMETSDYQAARKRYLDNKAVGNWPCAEKALLEMVDARPCDEALLQIMTWLDEARSRQPFGQRLLASLGIRKAVHL